jgi:DMSO/TMAO reductase YedYZ molybdopterin-dependent catalytic subunit
LIGLSYLGWQLAELPFIPFDLFDWLARVLPGDVVTFGIDSIVNLISAVNDLLKLGQTSAVAKTAEQLLALGLTVLIGAGVGLVIAVLQQRFNWSGVQSGFWVGLITFVLFGVVELDLGMMESPVPSLLWLGLLLVGWGLFIGRVLEVRKGLAVEEADQSRRAILVQVAGGSALLAVTAWGLGRWLGGQPEETGASQPLADLASETPEPAMTATAVSSDSQQATSPPDVTPTSTTREQVPPAPGTRPEVTSNEDFYRIDINTRPVQINKEEWNLETAGLFENPRVLTLADLMAFPTVRQPITLSCISNRIGGGLISTSYWTGLRLRDLLQDLGLLPEAQELYIEAADGFYESVAMQDMMDPRTLLVYGMNDETLPTAHGFPLRIYIPNRYGMKQPKWITRMEAIDNQGPGYWVDRGWSAEARPHIVSVIDSIAQDRATNGSIPIGGIAWAGDRGIQKVEVQVDDGEWTEATLRTPPLGPLTWVQWRYDWPSSSGRHQFRVRATDGTGMLQIEQETDVRPDGATGYHSLTEMIS